MAFTHRGDIPTEDMKMKAMQRLYQLLPNHKCPQKDCPFHPPVDETKEEEELDTKILVKTEHNDKAIDEYGGHLKLPCPPPEEDTEDEGISTDDCAPSDHESAITVECVEDRQDDDVDDAYDVDDEPPEVCHIPQRQADNHETITKEKPVFPRVPVEPKPAKYKLQVAPIFTAMLKSRCVPEGLSLRLTCSVTARPEPNIAWFKDGQEITSGPDYYIRNCGLLSLEVVTMKRKHAGVYTCEAYNDIGKASSSATIEIEEKEEVKPTQVEVRRPRFLTPLQDAVVMEGQDVTFHCKATGKPMPTFTWLKDMLELKTSSRVEIRSDEEGESTLTIRQLDDNDAGLYLVRAKSKSGRCQSAGTLRVQGISTRAGPWWSGKQVETPPSFTIRLPYTMDVNEGEKLKLDCSVQGFPTPIVTWYKGHRGLIYGQRHRIMFAGSLHTLEIPQTMVLDSGDYHVKAVNSAGSVQSCCLVTTHPSKRDTDTEYKPMEDDITLEISAAGPANTSETEDAREHRQISKHSGDPPKLYVDELGLRFLQPLPVEMTASLGDRVTLSCLISQSVTRITWFKNDRRLNFRTQRITSVTDEGGRASLHVSEVQESDAGQYRCVAIVDDGSQIETTTQLVVSDSSSGEPAVDSIKDSMTNGELGIDDSGTRNVSFLDAPQMPETVPEHVTMLILDPRSQHVDEGQNAKFKVAFEGSSAALSWSLNGKRLQTGSKYKMYQEDGHHFLEVCDVVANDSGTYTAIFDNSTVTDSAELVVKEKPKPAVQSETSPPPAVTSPLKNMEVVIGDRDVKLRCEVSNGDGTVVTWYHNGQKLQQNSQYRMMFKGMVASLVLTQIAGTDAGEYRCVVKNAGGQSVTSCIVSTRDAEVFEPPVFVQELHDMEVESGDEVEIVCEVEDADLDSTAHI